MGMSAAGDTASSFKFYRGTTDITDDVTIASATAGGSLKTGGFTLAGTTTYSDVIVTFTDEEVITADTSQTYYLKATLTGVGTLGESIQTYILGDAALPAFNAGGAGVAGDLATYAVANAKNFVWTDRSVPTGAGHGLTTEDWTDAYLVKTLVSDTYTLSK